MRLIILLTCIAFTSYSQVFIGTTQYPTINAAAQVATSGQTVLVKGGTYRETIVAKNSGVKYIAEGKVLILGTKEVTGTWTQHAPNIWKTTVTLPLADQFQEYTNGTTESILANQVFQNNEMVFLARWPNVSTTEDLFDKGKMRTVANSNGWTDNSISDPNMPNGLTGGSISENGWFITITRKIDSQSGTTIRWNNGTISGPKFKKFYYVTNALSLLDAPKEWYYKDNTLYFYSTSAPTGIEFKARNFGFDLRNVSNVTIQGFEFIGCDPVITSNNSANIIVDNIRAKWINHSFIQMAQGSYGDSRSARQCGLKLNGTNNVLKNSEIKYAGAMGVYLGQGSRAENNLIEWIAYDGMRGAGFKFWERFSNQVVTRNTVAHTGRGSIETSYGADGHNKNLDISYNDFSDYNKLSVDGGAIYGEWLSDHTGGRIHHNYFHDSGVVRTGGVDGVQVNSMYMDQTAGPFTFDHNVVAAKGDECDMYNEISNEVRNMGGHKVYNNVFAGTTDRSYITYAHVGADVQRNNIYTGSLVNAKDVQYAIYRTTDPQFVGGTGHKAYMLKPTSPGYKKGLYISGISENPTASIGAFENDTPWEVGYKSTGTAPVNTPPTISILTSNTTYPAGASIIITATATDDKGVSKVEFFNGATKLGESSSPYSYVLSNAVAGTYNFTGKATDNEGASTTSSVRIVTVTGTIEPPTAPATKDTTFVTTGPGIIPLAIPAAQYTVTVKMVKVIPPPTAVKIEAETFISSQGVHRETYGIGSTNAGSYASYKRQNDTIFVVFTSGQGNANCDWFEFKDGKVTIRYTRGNSGNGTAEIRQGSLTGAVLHRVTFPSTGSWNTFSTVTQ